MEEFETVFIPHVCPLPYIENKYGAMNADAIEGTILKHSCGRYFQCVQNRDIYSYRILIWSGIKEKKALKIKAQQ